MVHILVQNAVSYIALEYESKFDAIELAKKQINQFINENIKGNNIYINFWCLQEMMANAIEHGNRFDPSKKVYVDVEITEQQITFTIRDNGNGFDWRSKLHQEYCLLSSDERGRGVVMSNMFCSKLMYNEIGNQVTIVYLFEDLDLLTP